MFFGMKYDPDSDTIAPIAIAIVSPDWTGFKSALFVDSEFDQLYSAAGEVSQLAKDALIPSLLQYESGQTDMFSMVSTTNLVSNLGVVAADTSGVGTARSSLAAASYG